MLLKGMIEEVLRQQLNMSAKKSKTKNWENLSVEYMKRRPQAATE